MRLIIKSIIALLIFLVIVFLGIYFNRVKVSNKLTALKKYHYKNYKLDIYDYDKYKNFGEYLEKEKIFLDEIYNEYKVDKSERLSKFNRESENSPYVDNENLNCSFELYPKGDIKGGVLMIHGLTDSPYSQRELANIFVEKGYYVLAIRLPGHGTVAGELVDVKWESWLSAVKFGAKMVNEKIENIDNSKFIISGYSLGGTLSLAYFLESLENKELKKTDKLYWIVPAMQISEFAKYGHLNKYLSWIEKYNKFKWLDIEPEYDPFKTNSFPKNAGKQLSDLIEYNNKLLKKIEAKNIKTPEIYTFSLLKDGTVYENRAYSILNEFKNRSGATYIFDVNRYYDEIMSDTIRNFDIKRFAKEHKIEKDLYFISNYRSKKNDDIRVYKVYNRENKNELEVDEVKKLDSYWGKGNFALSHVGISNSPENSFYGKNSFLGGSSLKGEKGVYTIGTYDMMRLRYNPFFKDMKKIIEDSLDK